MQQQTPMMTEYRRIKDELPADALLLFRLGDFYEMFFDDAIEGAHLLNMVFTKRGDTPMCGIPYHNAPNCIATILQAGRKVAICEQMEEASPGQRTVTQILSPAQPEEGTNENKSHNLSDAIRRQDQSDRSADQGPPS